MHAGQLLSRLFQKRSNNLNCSFNQSTAHRIAGLSSDAPQKIIPAKDPKQCVCEVQNRKSRDLDALGPREVMVVMKVGNVVTVTVVGVSEGARERGSE